MKKITILFVMVILVGSLLADEIMQPAGPSKSVESPANFSGYLKANEREIPTWSWVNIPVDIISTYYDYQPGSYCSSPLRVQPEISQPFGNPADGAYFVFHISETSSATRRVYYAYIDSSGNVLATDPVASWDLTEGYAGIDIDPVTGDPMVAFHVNMDDESLYEDAFTYDLYHLLGTAGLWTTPYAAIDNSDLQGAGVLPFEDDEFIWPYTYVGESPLGEEYRRVYITANNFTGAHGSQGDPSENVLLAYADFTNGDLDLQLEFDWNYRTIEQFDNWNAEDPEWIRPFKAMTVRDNVVAYIGYHTGPTADDGYTYSKFFALINDNYGEGPFEYYEADATFPIENPMNEAGTEYLYSDVNTPGIPYETLFEPLHSGHMDAKFIDNGNKLCWMGAMGITFDALDGNGPGYYYPNWLQVYPKLYYFDLANEEFGFYDLYIEGANPADDQLMIPWDLDEDGEVDSYDADGYPEWPMSWTVYWHVGDDAFHENYYHLATNEENGWMAAVWSDGTKAKLVADDLPGADPAWESTPEIMITVSGDHGATWSEPIRLNANETPELAGQIPEYIYPADVIKDLGNNEGLLQFAYLDDNSWGSYIQANGLNNGGIIKYASLKIVFPEDGSTQPSVVPVAGRLSQNYPNPFNPETTINYEMTQPGNVTIEIYNIKGQKIKTLVNSTKDAGEHSVVWNGRDESGNSVSSGVYFYKMQAGKYTSTKKMILMK
ncbi:MAG: T9SS type A sorting domain-containing protein [Candidatus Cloacimonadota bacterium]|nr:T9SS type A sorting domain-containing protein [Candidatus Cloacimonadota bacterium]